MRLSSSQVIPRSAQNGQTISLVRRRLTVGIDGNRWRIDRPRAPAVASTGLIVALVLIEPGLTIAGGVALALSTLGGDYKITTPVFVTINPDDFGRVNGDLIISGRGDPSWKAATNFWDNFTPFIAVLTSAWAFASAIPLQREPR